MDHFDSLADIEFRLDHHAGGLRPLRLDVAVQDAAAAPEYRAHGAGGERHEVARQGAGALGELAPQEVSFPCAC